MRKPRVSIVMCTYNGEAYLQEQLESIAAQTFVAEEVIIVDDASTDNTWPLLCFLKETCHNTRLYRNNTNLGFNKNFEKAIGLATGEYISIADQDDIWLPSKTELLVEAMLQNPENMLAHCRSASICDGKICYANHKLHRHFEGDESRALLFFNHINGHSMMFRRTLLTYIIPVPGRMFYDWWIAIIATSLGRIVSVNEPLVHHRLHAANAHFTKDPKNEPDHDEVIDYILSIPMLGTDTRIFAQKLSSLIKNKTASGKKIYWPLFLFLFTYRQIIFGHKKRFLPVFSYLKNSIKYAKAGYRHSGVSF